MYKSTIQLTIVLFSCLFFLYSSLTGLENFDACLRDNKEIR